MSFRVPSAVPEGLLYALIIFAPFAFGAVEPWSVAVLEALAFLLAFSSFLRGADAPAPQGRWAWLVPAAAAVFGLLQIYNAVLPDGPRPSGPFTVSPRDTAQAALLWCAYAAVLYSVPRIVVNHRVARRFAWVLFLLCLAVSVLGFAQAATSKDLIYWTRPTLLDVAPFGPFYNKDHAADLLAMGLAVVVGLLGGKLARTKAVDKNGVFDWRPGGAMAGGLAVIFLAVAFCGSRGALLALCLGGAALAALGSVLAADRASARLWGAGGLAALALVVMLAYMHVESGARAGAVDPSVSGRLKIYGASWRRLLDSPVFGTGLGSFAVLNPAYQDQSLRGFVSHAHCDWLEAALDAGLVGVAVALAAFAFLVWAGVRAWRDARSVEMRWLAGGMLGGTLVFAAHAFVEFSFQIPSNAVFVFSLAGALLSAPAWTDKDASPAASAAPEPSLAAGAAAICLLMSWLAAAPAVAALTAQRTALTGNIVGGLGRALEFDADPDLRRRLARSLADLSGRGLNFNAPLLRAALAHSLAAASARPFDAQALYQAASCLWRLDRKDDALALIERRDLVTFLPYRPAVYKVADGDRAKLEALEQLGLLPSGVKPR